MDKDQIKLFGECIVAMGSIVAIRGNASASISPADWERLRNIRSNLVLIYAVETHGGLGGLDDPVWRFADAV